MEGLREENPFSFKTLLFCENEPQVEHLVEKNKK